ncbi:MAG: hypothetical protein CMB99_10295 [Flavobacteriaceae bacterium]|nr:hypothetical protein [Flavobacteriaceae bacterium]|tara:strand:- start:278281 stop:278877 length:597 start_codon:yes stop_codon:yes gene_type:complete
MAQKRVVRSVTYKANLLEVSTLGLDEIKVETIDGDKVEVLLLAENTTKQFVIFEEGEEKLILRFQFQSLKRESTVFRKYITERLERGTAIIRVPKNTSINITGENCNVIVDADLNDFSLDLLNSIIRFNKIPKQSSVQFHAGNFYTKMRDQSIDLKTNTGTLSIDGEQQPKKTLKMVKENSQKLRIRTIKGNIFLTSQ